jgi:predicted Zn-dependent protease
MSSGGGSSSSSSSSSSSRMGYSDAEKAVKAKQYRKAIAILEKVVRRDPNNVDAMNYLGYSHRQLGEFDKALVYYQAALRKNANHRGVNEYLGQLYLRTGKPKQAKAQLARLRVICGTGCEEYESLKAAIARAEGS